MLADTVGRQDRMIRNPLLKEFEVLRYNGRVGVGTSELHGEISHSFATVAATAGMPSCEVRLADGAQLPPQTICRLDGSKAEMYALWRNEVLDCLIGPDFERREAGAFGWMTERIPIPLYITVNDVRRWQSIVRFLQKVDKHTYKDDTLCRELRACLAPSAELDKYSTIGHDQKGIGLCEIFPSMANMTSRLLISHVANFNHSPGDLLNKAIFIVIHGVPEMDRHVWLSFVLPMVYGGIHLAAWKFHFASRSESLIWRVACAIISLGLLISTLLLISLHQIWNFCFGSRPVVWDYLEGLVYPLCVVYGALRVYLVTESFFSLRYVPIGVFAAVPWVQNIPHV